MASSPADELPLVVAPATTTAQDLVKLLPKAISKEGWPVPIRETIDAKIRENPPLLREAPYPLHKFLVRLIPLSVLQTCLEVDPEIQNIMDDNGKTPLDICLKSPGGGDCKTLELLFQGKQHLAKEISKDGKTMLHRVCLRSLGTANLSALQIIYQAHPEALMHKDTNGNLPIHYFRKISRCLDAIRFFVQQEPSLLAIPNSKGRLLLHEIFGHGLGGAYRQDEAFEYLFQAYPEAAGVADDEGNFPLHLAARAEACKLATLQQLLQAHPKAVCTANHNGYYPLHQLVRASIRIKKWQTNEPTEQLRLLLDAYPEAAQIKTPETTDDESSGYLPLHLACRSGNNAPKEYLQILVEAYPEAIRCKGRHGVFPFHLACAINSNLPVLQYLAEQYPDVIQMPDYRGYLPVHLVPGNPDAIAWLLKEYTEGLTRVIEKNGRLLYHLVLWNAVNCRTPEIYRPVLEQMSRDYPESLLMADKKGNLPLHIAVSATNDVNQDMILSVLAKCMEAALQPKNDGVFLIHAACSAMSPNKAVVDALMILHPQGIQMPDDKGRLPLHHACGAAHKLWFVKQIVEYFPEAISMATENGRLPLHLACEYRADLDLIKYLYELYPAAMTMESACGRLPIHYACACRPRPARAIALSGGKHYPENETELSMKSVLQFRHTVMAFEGMRGRPIQGQGTVEWIVQQFPDVAVYVDHDGWLPLHAACANGLYNGAIEALLVAFPGAVFVQDNEGWLPLHLEVAWGHPRDIVQHVIGRDPPTLEEWERPLRFDYSHHHPGHKKEDVLSSLLAADPESIKVADSQGWLPLHCALASGNEDLVAETYKQDFPQAFSTATTDNGSLPIHILAAKKNVPRKTALAVIGAFPDGLDAKDQSGRTPLDVARAHDRNEIATFLEEIRAELGRS